MLESTRPCRHGTRQRHAQRLLHGVTGSGKTEIYLRATAAALEQGRGAIVLVPEIALTPQIVGRFRERFGDTVAVLHSRLRPAERYEEWRRLRSGEARVCVGPRSAVFAPIEELGLIVVDEEHDASYKHEGDPRYDARDVAAAAARCGALLLLGSATPRPESVHACPACGCQRVDGRPLPEVEILDMRGQAHGLHPVTAHALAEVRSAGGKAIVLLNRRGWSNFLSCRSCGRVWSCPRLRRRARPAPRRGLRRLPPLRPPRARAGALWRLRLDLGRPPRRGHRAPRSTISRPRSTTGPSRCSAWTPTLARRTAAADGGVAARAAPLRGAPRRAC